MKQRFILFRRRNTFYCEDTTTGRKTSLRTGSEAEAKTLLYVRIESVRQPSLNLQIARTYLAASDSGISHRTSLLSDAPPSEPGIALRCKRRVH